jgi:hypothetical protein
MRYLIPHCAIILFLSLVFIVCCSPRTSWNTLTDDCKAHIGHFLRDPTDLTSYSMINRRQAEIVRSCFNKRRASNEEISFRRQPVYISLNLARILDGAQVDHQPSDLTFLKEPGAISTYRLTPGTVHLIRESIMNFGGSASAEYFFPIVHIQDGDFRYFAYGRLFHRSYIYYASLRRYGVTDTVFGSTFKCYERVAVPESYSSNGFMLGASRELKSIQNFHFFPVQLMISILYRFLSAVRSAEIAIALRYHPAPNDDLPILCTSTYYCHRFLHPLHTSAYDHSAPNNNAFFVLRSILRHVLRQEATPPVPWTGHEAIKNLILLLCTAAVSAVEKKLFHLVSENGRTTYKCPNRIDPIDPLVSIDDVLRHPVFETMND